MPDSDIEQSVAEAFSGIDRVDSVYLIPHGETFHVFTVIDSDDEETYDRIYDQERLLIHRFRGVHFDFNVVAQRGRAVDEIVGSRGPIWRRNETYGLCLTGAST